VPSSKQTVCGIAFKSYGASFEGYPTAYLTAAAALGMSEGDVEKFEQRLKSTLKDYFKSLAKRKGESRKGLAPTDAEGGVATSPV
jgi:hypothetical protein